MGGNDGKRFAQLMVYRILLPLQLKIVFRLKARMHKGPQGFPRRPRQPPPRSVVVVGARRKMGYAPKNATCRAVTSSLPWSLNLTNQEGTWTV